MRPRLGLITGQTKAHSLVPLLWAFAGGAAYFATPHNGRHDRHVAGRGDGHATTKIEDITGVTGDDAIFFPGASGSIQFGADRATATTSG